MRVSPALKYFKVGDFVLVLPYNHEGQYCKDFLRYRQEYYGNSNDDLNDDVMIGTVVGLVHGEDEILLEIELSHDRSEHECYSPERVVSLSKL